jgi:hypothetical protein
MLLQNWSIHDAAWRNRRHSMQIAAGWVCVAISYAAAVCCRSCMRPAATLPLSVSS